MRPGSLQGIKVLDLSRVLAGPWASQILGDLGADVVKVERLGEGDDTRKWGPPWWSADEAGDECESAYFLCANRNKRSIGIDLASEEGQAQLRQLAAEADVVLENFKVGGLKRYGLDYESLRELNPGLVYCSITGFGQTGPYAERPGYDFLIQGMGGLMSLTGAPDNVPGGGPMKVGVALVDVMTGLYATIAVLAALQHRQRTGEGQYIDLALFDVAVACLANQASSFLVSGESPTRLGNSHPSIVPYQTFATVDGHIILAIGNDGQFARFCAVAGRPEWASDPRFATNPARVENREALVRLIAEVVRGRPTREWIESLELVNVPCGPINTLAEVFQDPQVQARGLFIQVARERGGRVPLVASPIRMSRTPVQYRQAPPALGEQGDAVLRDWLGEDA